MSGKLSAKLNERLLKAMRRAKIAWLVTLAAAGWFASAYLPVWAWLLLFPFAFLSYTVIIYATVVLLSYRISPEELAQAEASNMEVAAATQPAPPPEIVAVPEVGPVIGTYKDNPIFEYILVQIPGQSRPEKLMYHGPANVVDGIVEIPDIDGMLFACAENILYAVQQK